jgi:hypothetical protein
MKKIILTVIFITLAAQTVHSYGPTRKSMSFSLTIGPSFTWSTFAEQEDLFTKELNFYLYKTDPVTGIRDSQELRYKYADIAGEAWAIYYPSNTIGAGLFYRYGRVNQKSNVLGWNKFSCLLSLHRVGFAIQYWPEIVDDFGFSFFFPVGAAIGELNRLAILEGNYQNRDTMRDFIISVNKTVQCTGIFTGLSFSVSHKIFTMLSVALIVDYEWTWVQLAGDKISGYPQNDYVNEIGCKVGLIWLASRTGQREIFR